jgi:hypothetical protein
MTHNFQPWPKIARLNRDITITEKIDGTNAAIGIQQIPEGMVMGKPFDDLSVFRQTNTTAIVSQPLEEDEFGTPPPALYWVWSQSRNRVITPGKSTDNSGFAGWVAEHADVLVTFLGEGLHFGEWWGRGIQRGYDQDGKRFSLFNTHRYSGLASDPVLFDDGTALTTVPELYRGPFGEYHIQSAINDLDLGGSRAAPGFMRPEGVIVFHQASQVPFKVTIEGDGVPKGLIDRG